MTGVFTKTKDEKVTDGIERVGPKVKEGIQRVGPKVKDRVLETGRKAGLGWLDLYEKTLKSTADLQQSVGEATQVESFSKIASAQADFTREMAEAYTSAGRDLLKSK